MKNQPKRICIYPKDIQTITGKSYRQSVRLFGDIKKSLNRSESQLLSVEEFCHFTGLKKQEVDPLILG
jgi:hypothetical protein